MNSIFQVEAGAVSDYILQSQKEENDPIVFKLKTLSTREFSLVMGQYKMSVDDSMSSIPAEALYKAFQIGLVGWENAKDEAGNEVKFSPAQKEKIGFNIMAEIGNEIITRSKIDGEQVKN